MSLPTSLASCAAARLAMLLCLAVWCATAAAEVMIEGQLHDRVLQSATVTTAAGTPVLVIDLIAPVHYAWHFPATPAKEVLIALHMRQTPHATTDRPDYREYLTVPPAVRDVVQDIAFESSELNGNFIVLHFATPVSITVSHGATTYQLLVAVHPADQDRADDAGAANGPQGDD